MKNINLRSLQPDCNSKHCTAKAKVFVSVLVNNKNSMFYSNICVITKLLTTVVNKYMQLKQFRN